MTDISEILSRILPIEASFKTAFSEFLGLGSNDINWGFEAQISLKAIDKMATSNDNCAIYSFFLSSLESPSKCQKEQENLKFSTREPRARERSISKKRPSESIEFLEFFNCFPKHINRVSAHQKFNYQLRFSGAPPEALIAGAKRYAAYCRKEAIEPKFIKAPDVWLNKGCWQDELDLGPSAKILPVDKRSFEEIKRDWIKEGKIRDK